MELTTLDEELPTARRKYLEYRAACKQNPNADDEALKNAYREVAKGKQVFSLLEVLQEAGLDEDRRPRLAFAQANSQFCWCAIQSDGSAKLRWVENRWTRGRRNCREFEPGFFPDLGDGWQLPITGRAIVPSVPPLLRPQKSLHRYHILWDAVWTKDPPVDPVLCKHLGRDLYAVVAVWDLTDLERAVLRR